MLYFEQNLRWDWFKYKNQVLSLINGIKFRWTPIARLMWTNWTISYINTYCTLCMRSICLMIILNVAHVLFCSIFIWLLLAAATWTYGNITQTLETELEHWNIYNNCIWMFILYPLCVCKCSTIYKVQNIVGLCLYMCRLKGRSGAWWRMMVSILYNGRRNTYR